MGNSIKGIIMAKTEKIEEKKIRRIVLDYTDKNLEIIRCNHLKYRIEIISLISVS